MKASAASFVIGWLDMSLNQTAIQFDFNEASDASLRNDGWGVGALTLAGRPYWFGGSEAEPKPFEWTWVDLLEHLAETWSALVSEEAYPFDWLGDAKHPGEIWSVAERRWAGRGNETALAEEPRLLAFERQHNLAAGWQGINLPALIWLRTGKVVWLSPEVGPPIRASFNECREALVSIAEKLAQAFASSTNARVAAAVRAWRGRGGALRKSFLELATGLSDYELARLQSGKDAYAFWEIPAANGWESGAFESGELLAAARMTAGVVDLGVIQTLLAAIRKVKRGASPMLDSLSARAVAHVARASPKFAFEGGYLASDFLKVALPEASKKYVLVDALLEHLGVEVTEVDFGTDKIDAVAVWGARGPAIVLNSARAYAVDAKRTRITLAHELCHILLDRSGGLPFCDVIGGKVDAYVERRAKAFAAELLLPRQSVEYEWSMWRAGRFSDFQHSLSQVYGVSKTVICAQVYNSDVFAKLDRVAQDYVLRRLREFEGPGSDAVVPYGAV